MTELHAHRWHIENFEHGVLKGVCMVKGCDAVSFYPADCYDAESVKRVATLNKKCGHTGISTMPGTKWNPSHAWNSNNKEEPEVKTEMILQPITDMPNTDGMGPKAKGLILRPWYEKHKADILADIEKLGKEPARKRWQIPSQTFLNLRRDWGMPIDGTHAHNTKHQGDVQKSTENVQKMPVNESEDIDTIRIKIDPKDEVKPVDSDCHVSPVDGESRKDGKAKPNLPDYPPFDAAWKEDVQREWIRVYGLMTVGGKIA